MGIVDSLFGKRSKVGDVVHVYEKPEEKIPEKVEELIEKVESADIEKPIVEEVVEVVIPAENKVADNVVEVDGVNLKKSTSGGINMYKAENITTNKQPKKERVSFGSPKVDVSNDEKNRIRLLKIKHVMPLIEQEKKDSYINMMKG